MAAWSEGTVRGRLGRTDWSIKHPRQEAIERAGEGADGKEWEEERWKKGFGADEWCQGSMSDMRRPHISNGKNIEHLVNPVVKSVPRAVFREKFQPLVVLGSRDATFLMHCSDTLANFLVDYGSGPATVLQLATLLQLAICCDPQMWTVWQHIWYLCFRFLVVECPIFK